MGDFTQTAEIVIWWTLEIFALSTRFPCISAGPTGSLGTGEPSGACTPPTASSISSLQRTAAFSRLSFFHRQIPILTACAFTKATSTIVTQASLPAPWTREALMRVTFAGSIYDTLGSDQRQTHRGFSVWAKRQCWCQQLKLLC